VAPAAPAEAARDAMLHFEKMMDQRMYMH